MVVLRDYQELGLSKTRQSYRNGFRRPILVAPTGAGKTVIAGEVIAGATAKQKKIMFLAGRKELVDQCSAKVDELGIDHGIIQGKHWRQNYSLPVQVGSIQTVVNRNGIDDPDIIIVDECHHAISSSWQKCLDRWPKSLFLGLTATPYRLDNRGLGHLFDTIIPLTTTEKLTQSGYLVPSVVYAPSEPALEDCGSGKEYNKQRLNIECDRPELVGDILRHWVEHAYGRQTLAFAVSVEHSKHIRDEFLRAGIRAEHVDGSFNVQDRVAAFERFKNRETTVLCNVEIATEGYDNPEVSCIILGRPTKSRCLWRQTIGRGLRTAPWIGKTECIVLDHANLTRQHGFIEDPDHYDISGLQTTKHRTGTISGPSVRICPECFSAFRCGIIQCPYCDYTFPRPKFEMPKIKEGNLVLAKHGMYMPNSDDKKKRMTFDKLVAKAKDKGYKIKWVHIQYKIRFGEQLPYKWAKEIV